MTCQQTSGSTDPPAKKPLTDPSHSRGSGPGTLSGMLPCGLSEAD